MGLDQYLEKMPRYRGATARDVAAVESYLSWIKAKEEGSKYANCTFEEWCGSGRRIPSQKYIDFYSNHYEKKYSSWDTEKKYGFTRITEEIGYWRKANQIHNWFVENIQNGEDDCDYHREVTEEDLKELLDVCNKVLASCELVPSNIENGYSFDENGNKVYDYVDGLAVKDPSIAAKLLPTTSGFFFGGTEYDEWYVNDIKNTIDIITKALETTNFDTEMIYYVSSW